MQSAPFGVFALQTHWPPEHPMELVAQFMPHVPQLLTSDWRFTHVPLHDVRPPLHTHCPAVHV
jgi:hypothetical protein